MISQSLLLQFGISGAQYKALCKLTKKAHKELCYDYIQEVEKGLFGESFTTGKCQHSTHKDIGPVCGVTAYSKYRCSIWYDHSCSMIKEHSGPHLCICCGDTWE